MHHMHVDRSHRTGGEWCGGERSDGGEEERGAGHGEGVASEATHCNSSPKRGGGPLSGAEWWRGPAVDAARRWAPSTMLRMVPLPVPGRISKRLAGNPGNLALHMIFH